MYVKMDDLLKGNPPGFADELGIQAAPPAWLSLRIRIITYVVDRVAA